jgi:hypothetical protein
MDLSGHHCPTRSKNRKTEKSFTVRIFSQHVKFWIDGCFLSAL